MVSGSAPSAGARILSLRCDPALLVARHARCHSAAEYLADVASAAGPDTAMAARELSACLFELFELLRLRPPAGRFELVLRAVDDGVTLDVLLPGEDLEPWLEWAAPAAEAPDPLGAPDPGDGLRELAAVHGVAMHAAAVDGGVRLALRVSLCAGEGFEEVADAV